MQIIPAIDVRGGRCVRLRQGDYARETVLDDDPVRVARRWAEQGAERLHLVDLDGAKAGRPVNLRTLRAIVRAVDIPCQVGGGIRDMATIQAMFREVGADRVIIGTQALKRPVWFEEMVATFPGRIVLGVDARDGRVATEGWMETSRTTARDLVARYREQPLAAVVYTNIANDGMMQGVDPGTLDDLE
ncbi:MAG: 1-(5-phosphoribosyl)-5-((5-phosphoribosylamino)methylideneamino)imidazole-4-carboxamide isomerase, partial [Planctomycetota bacterium]